MARSSTPIEGEPSGVIAVPIPEAGDLRFVDLIRRYYVPLGESGADRVLWRTIDNPRRTDSAYEAMRTEEQRIADGVAAQAYDDLIAGRGGDDHHRAREYSILEKMLDVSSSDRPCLVLSTSPVLRPQPRLRIPKSFLETRAEQNRLGNFLVEHLAASIVDSVLEDEILSPKSMIALQNKIIEIESLLHELAGEGAISRPAAMAGYALYTTKDLSKCVGEEDYGRIKKATREFDLVVNVLEGAIYIKNAKSQPRPPRNRAIRILAEVMQANRPIKIRETGIGRQTAVVTVSMNTFNEARKWVQDRLRSRQPLFRTIRHLSPRDTAYVFEPPDSFKWAVFYPPE